ncbi:ABC transporter ATP-binding protein [Synergistales bacterium]|nr:ABC transporter ATP-binding protein [Synergistales bacterium]
MLKIENLTIQFGGLTAVNDVSMMVEPNKIYGLIGPNGAGKTTFFNLISGVYEPTVGNVLFNGQRLNGMQPYQINKAGISRTYQVINLFKKMTVVDNVLVGMHTQLKSNFISSILHNKKEREEEKAALEIAYNWLDFVGIRHHAADFAGNLSYGEQRLLEIVRGLSSKPQLLLLDEPAAGMHAAEKEKLRVIVRNILDNLHVTLLVIEHDMKLMMELAEYIYVLDFGKKLAEGTPKIIQNNPDVIAAYLGDE